MGQQTNIQWTDSTWNPFLGCTKVSEGCKYCYMFRFYERFNGNMATDVRRSSDKTFFAPLKWKMRKSNVWDGKPLIFPDSMSDFFHPMNDINRADAWKVIKDTPHFVYQMLTKRIERAAQCFPEDWGEGYPNVMIGVSAENQQRYDERFWHLTNTKAVKKFISIEPLLGQIQLYGEALQWDYWSDEIDWIIVGGESGFEQGNYLYRPCMADWIRSIVFECKAREVPVFVKQMGTHIAKMTKMKNEKGGFDMHGSDINQFPADLRIREFPFLWDGAALPMQSTIAGLL